MRRLGSPPTRHPSCLSPLPAATPALPFPSCCCSADAAAARSPRRRRRARSHGAAARGAGGGAGRGLCDGCEPTLWQHMGCRGGPGIKPPPIPSALPSQPVNIECSAAAAGLCPAIIHPRAPELEGDGRAASGADAAVVPAVASARAVAGGATALPRKCPTAELCDLDFAFSHSCKHTFLHTSARPCTLCLQLPTARNLSTNGGAISTHTLS
eukprot:364863-Chlamydomonas_euryale.AAC.7